VLSRLGAGTDRVDVAAATRCGIVVANVPDFCLDEQAEQTMTLLLACARRLPHMTAAMRRGEFTARHHPGVHRVAGRVLGLVGFGASAKAVAVRAKGFGLRLLAWARDPGKHRPDAGRLGVELVGLERLLSESDFVSVHLPLTPETRHLLDAGRLALMRPGAVLVNTARGAIVDEQALVEALRQGRLAGAGLDVFDGINVFTPPAAPPSHPLLELDNVILTPHCAGSSVESTLDSKFRGARNAAAVLMGRWPASVVNPGVRPRYPLGREGEAPAEPRGASGSAGASPSRTAVQLAKGEGEARREGEAPAEPGPQPGGNLALPPATVTPAARQEPRPPDESRPQRAHPAHGVVVLPNDPTIVFVTVCTKDRSRWLATPEVHSLLRSVWAAATAWCVGRYVIMPDHVHFFAAPGDPELPLENWVKYWKSQFTKAHRVAAHRWQTDHWDTRMRRQDIYEEKWQYVVENPVRHGLVEQAEDWPYRGELFELRW
jgi:phosphoglycerate dehydrogenase-like enzyme/REP element-mobilizing transposase RayT